MLLCLQNIFKGMFVSKEQHCRLFNVITYIHSSLIWFCSDIPYVGPVCPVYARICVTMCDVVRTIHRCATNFLLCDLLLARFQALSMKPRELPKTTFYAACREIGSLLSSSVIALNRISRLDREVVRNIVYAMSILM